MKVVSSLFKIKLLLYLKTFIIIIFFLVFFYNYTISGPDEFA